MSADSATQSKKDATKALSDVDGVGGIGFTWDTGGHRVLQVDLQPGTDRHLVEKRLSAVDYPYVLRTVSGFVQLG